jgi:hypothetical protein
MSEGYGEHCERLAGYGVGIGELCDYDTPRPEEELYEDEETIHQHLQERDSFEPETRD